MLRPYQTDIIDRTRLALRSHRSVCMQLPTGGGKTVIFSDITARATTRGRRVLMLAHRKELIFQAAATLQRAGVESSLVMPGEDFRPELRAAVASVQTLVRRDLGEWEPDVVIVDEAHHAAAESYQKILRRWPTAQIIGVTATPVRGDGKGLAQIFEALVCGPSAADLIRAGYLKPVEVYEGSALDDSALRKIGGEFTAKSQESAAEKPQLIGDAVREYSKICPGQPAIAFCVSVAEAESVAAQFTMAGWRCRAVHGGSPDRAEILDGLRLGQLDVVTSCDLIGEGTDIPRCACVILLRATQSVGLYLQMCGRGMRPHPDFPTCYILDHGGNYARHDLLPDDAIEWSLESGVRAVAKKDREKMPRRCPSCLALVAAPVPPVCPKCNAKMSVQKKGPVKKAGELRKVERDKISKALGGKPRRTIGQWKHIAQMTGNNFAWALRKFSEQETAARAAITEERRV